MHASFNWRLLVHRFGVEQIYVGGYIGRGNIAIPGLPYGIMEGDIIRTFDNNKDKIGHIQIADNPGRNEPGSGEINYENVFKHLSENYLGWIGCEYSPLGDTIKGLSWIDNIGGKSA